MVVNPGTEFRVDCHVKVLSEQVIYRAKKAGLDAIVYAPHFTRLPEIREQATAYSDEDLLVIPAREVFTGSWRNRKHILAIGLTDPLPDFIPLSVAIDELEAQGAAILAPHPEFLTVSLTEADLRQYRQAIDAIEIYNPKHLPRHNRRARELAGDLGYPPFTSSYAHLPETVGTAYTAFDRIDTEAGLVEALKEDVWRRVTYKDGLRRRLTTARELGHLCWENTYQKADRLFLSGIEPTHPRHIAYEGQFDDVSCY